MRDCPSLVKRAGLQPSSEGGGEVEARRDEDREEKRENGGRE